MEININKSGSKCEISLEGRLDASSSPEFEKVLSSSLDGADELELDLAKLVYISSAGLRVVLQAQKAMNKKGKMVIKNVQSTVMDVFEITGFTDILTIK